jgi:hypothetical protein
MENFERFPPYYPISRDPLGLHGASKSKLSSFQHHRPRDHVLLVYPSDPLLHRQHEVDKGGPLQFEA